MLSIYDYKSAESLISLYNNKQVSLKEIQRWVEELINAIRGYLI